MRSVEQRLVETACALRGVLRKIESDRHEPHEAAMLNRPHDLFTTDADDAEGRVLLALRKLVEMIEGELHELIEKPWEPGR